MYTVHKDGLVTSSHDDTMTSEAEWFAALAAVALRTFYGPKPRITIAYAGQFLASVPAQPSTAPAARLVQAMRRSEVSHAG